MALRLESHLISEVVQFEEGGPALHLCLNESGWGHLHVATTEVVVTKTENREKTFTSHTARLMD